MLKKLALLLALAPAALVAAERNDIPSCYTATKTTESKTPASGRLLTVVVDQTTPLSTELQKTAWGHIKRFVQPGDKLRLYTFSAYLNGHHTSLQFSGEFESPLAEDVLGNVPMINARKLQGCLAAQPKAAWGTFGRAFAGAMGTSSSDIPRSEILFSLREVAEDMRKAEGVTDQVVLLMSDMLEYSDFGSFYSGNAIREINPQTEMAKVEKQNLIPDFGGARVYVHGAAYVPTAQKNGYRSGKMIQSLEGFWTRYFDKGHADLRGFGHPELTAVME